MCIGDKSVERQIAFVDFGTEQNDAQKDPKAQMALAEAISLFFSRQGRQGRKGAMAAPSIFWLAKE